MHRLLKLAFLFLFCIFFSFAASFPGKKNSGTSNVSYEVKDFSYLLNITDFDDELLNMHFKLYEGYVKNANYLLEELQSLASSGKATSYIFGALKRRLGWEFDGMRLHELYFGNMGKKSTLNVDTPLYQAIVKDFGSFKSWKDDFMATGEIRGIGWVILYFDPKNGRLINTWINEHDVGHLATGDIILVMDVWEHAYLIQFGLNRKKYIDTFFNSIDWNVANQRYVQYRNLQNIPQ